MILGIVFWTNTFHFNKWLMVVGDYREHSSVTKLMLTQIHMQQLVPIALHFKVTHKIIQWNITFCRCHIPKFVTMNLSNIL